MDRPPGRLIVLEGIDGSGKTTLAFSLVEHFRRLGLASRATKEPTDGPLGRRIREIASAGRDTVSPEDEFDLFHRDREAHVRDVVRPGLSRGELIVQDRSFYSTMAYQGERGLDREAILAKERAIAPEPDVLIVVDVPVDVALARIQGSRGGIRDDFERRDGLERLRRVFLGIPGANVLDGTLERPELLARAIEVVSRRLSSDLTALRSD